MTALVPLADVAYVEPWWMQILKSIVIFAVGLQILPVMIVAERKVLGRFQNRYGPNRVGPFGILQPLADIVKLATKEQFRPRTSIGWLFALAPIISILTAVAALAIIPFGDTVDIFGTKIGLYGIDVSIGPLYLFAFGAIAFYGIMLGGWASGSKYSFLGSMRAAAQLISYEVAQGLALVGVIMTAQTLSLVGIVEAQQGMWYIVPQVVGFIIFLVAGFAETNRPPFDLVEADAELVGATTPSTAARAWSRTYFAEYLNVLVISRVVTTVFLGGWLLPFGIDPPGWVEPFVVLGEDDPLHLLLLLDPRDAAAPALRPADEPRLEDPPAAGDPQHPRHGDHPRGDRLTSNPSPMPWNPGDDVIAVQRAPQPGGAGGVYRAFGETLRGLKTTFARIPEGPVTLQYPEEKVPVYPRFRGRHRLHRFEDTGLEKCVGCSLCAAACPADCIRVVAAENTPENRVSAGERYAAVYEINLSRCIFCGYCEVACPFDAITMGHDYEMSDYHRSDLIFTKEMLLAEPFERTPLRGRGRVGFGAAHDGGPLLHRGASAPSRAPSASSRCATRSTACSRWSFHLLSLAALFLLLRAQFVAAAQVVVYAGAVMVLYVFVVAYVGAAEADALQAPVGGAQRAFAVGFALALFVELLIAVLGSGLRRIDTEGADRAARLRRRPSRSASCC